MPAGFLQASESVKYVVAIIVLNGSQGAPGVACATSAAYYFSEYQLVPLGLVGTCVTPSGCVRTLKC
jgi:hypothetical protein